ncbi:hypothetical protein FA95DRAFT_1613142 [Auriscalpium vulgare]|uniref:Uncharacterized protein n=1 Tax=Auriscalpium vulgare TaxID=40419 RepID=A0ACB8R4E0_9AGAM|nr:hypothetical protein FA95DRAFT_1613142 [Auriscalpium vulgare]
MSDESDIEDFREAFPEDFREDSDSDDVSNADTDDSRMYDFDLDSESSSDDEAVPARAQAQQHVPRGTLGIAAFKSIRYIQDQGLTLASLVDAVTWGDEECIANPTIRAARTQFFNSDRFAPMLRRWWKPPNRRAKKGPAELRKFVVECVGEMVEKEMKVVAPILTPPGDALSLETLTGLDFHKLSETLRSKDGAPTLWTVLQRAGWSDKQAARNTHKTPNNVIMNVIASLAFTRSHHVNRMSQLWAIYLKSCGLSERAFDTLHALGLTMSSKWTTEAVNDISEKAMSAARTAIEEHAYYMSYDNLNVAKRVFSMRKDNQNNFYSACAATLWVVPGNPPIPPEWNPKYQAMRREGARAPFDMRILLRMEQGIVRRNREAAVNVILRFLLESPAFSAYTELDDPILQRVQPVRALPTGKPVQQFILRTADINEATYEGNDQALHEWMRQLGLDSVEEQKKTSVQRVVVIVGDQLTVDRIRGLIKYRCKDMNGFERLDWVVPVFGWFHLVMVFANSIHKQYLGTSAGIGLQKAFDLLERKGLRSTLTKGPFWHNLDEALHHMAEGIFRACWLEIGGVDKLEHLTARSPDDLFLLAEDIYDKLASRRALMDMVADGTKNKDEFRYQTVMFNSDILSYLVLRRGISRGDPGRMEDQLPDLALRFAGGNNNKYTIEILDILQGLKKEWPPELRTYIREHCWLVNRTGKAGAFTAADQAQEQNIKDLKVTYRASGPSATLELLGKVSPAVPVFRAVKKCIKWQFKTVASRGDRHTAPAKEKDVALYQEVVFSENWLKYEEGRTFKKAEDRAKDVMDAGAVVLAQGDGAFKRWWSNRDFERSTEESWLEDAVVETQTGSAHEERHPAQEGVGQ